MSEVSAKTITAGHKDYLNLPVCRELDNVVNTIHARNLWQKINLNGMRSRNIKMIIGAGGGVLVLSLLTAALLLGGASGLSTAQIVMAVAAGIIGTAFFVYAGHQRKEQREAQARIQRAAEDICEAVDARIHEEGQAVTNETRLALLERMCCGEELQGVLELRAIFIRNGLASQEEIDELAGAERDDSGKGVDTVMTPSISISTSLSDDEDDSDYDDLPVRRTDRAAVDALWEGIDDTDNEAEERDAVASSSSASAAASPSASHEATDDEEEEEAIDPSLRTAVAGGWVPQSSKIRNVKEIAGE